MNDTTFIGYGGSTGTTTPPMRQAAYQIAEQQMTNYIGTFLLPTVVTGTWDYQFGNGYLPTDWGYVSNLQNFRVLDKDGGVVRTLSGTYNFAAIHDDTFGYIYIQDLLWSDNDCLNDLKHTISKIYPFINKNE